MAEPIVKRLIAGTFRVVISPCMASIWITILMMIAALVVVAGLTVAALFVGIGLLVGAVLVIVGIAIGVMSIAFTPVATMRFMLGYQTLSPIIEELRDKANKKD